MHRPLDERYHKQQIGQSNLVYWVYRSIHVIAGVADLQAERHGTWPACFPVVSSPPTPKLSVFDYILCFDTYPFPHQID